MRRRFLITALAALCGLGLSGEAAQAGFTPITFTGDGGTTGATANLKAEAVFTVVGAGTASDPYLLQVVLTNTSTTQALNPAQVLTGLFFDVAPAVSTPATAGISATSAFAQAYNGVTGITSQTNIGGEWFFRGGNTPLTSQGQQFGLGTAGFGVFGTPYIIGGPDLDGLSNNGGTSFGLVNQGFANGGGNGGMDDRVYVMNSATFTMTIPANVDPVNITNVRFQYGTGLNEASLSGEDGTVTSNALPTPAPAGLVLMAGAVPFLGLIRRRFRAAQTAA